ncbi:MAG: YdiU family protein [Planctomycetota bacterium]
MNQASPNLNDPHGWQFQHTFGALPDVFFDVARPQDFPAPQMVVFNHELADALGLRMRDVDPHKLAEWFSGRELPRGARPIAQAYAGHQFGGFTMLGDGRALLLGEQSAPDGSLVDIQFKGSGPTVYSRRGDGLAAVGPMLREYLISEAMAAMGIPTTRSLAVVATGRPVYRERPLPGAVLTRTAASHLRVGTFQFAAGIPEPTAIAAITHYAIARHDPQLLDLPEDERTLAFFRNVMQRQAELIADWQSVGFVHGVMNTDNMTISGESIDYGPCAFIDAYHPDTVFSSIDTGGRYRFGNQPVVAQWNLSRLAEALLPLFHENRDQAVEIANDAIGEFPKRFQVASDQRMNRKLGLSKVRAGDSSLVQSLLDWMQESASDYTTIWHRLTDEAEPARISTDPAFSDWHAQWLRRLKAEGITLAKAQSIMQAANPYVIPRNHLVQSALDAAEDEANLSPFLNLLAAVQDPYSHAETQQPYASGPPDGHPPCVTYCGT